MIDPNASDWSDLDLLTMTDVKERLVTEILVVEQQISSLEAGRSGDVDAGSADLEASQRRLQALRKRLAMVTSG